MFFGKERAHDYFTLLTRFPNWLLSYNSFSSYVRLRIAYVVDTEELKMNFQLIMIIAIFAVLCVNTFTKG